MNLSFLQPGDQQWAAFLRAVPHDFYHLPTYARLAESFESGTAEAALVTRGDQYLFLPYVVRRLSDIGWLGAAAENQIDVVSPYGYPGPLCRGEDEFLRGAVREWVDAMGARGAVSGFIRLHPLLNAECEPLRASGELVARGPTVSVDLALTPEVLWSQTGATFRNEISQARRAGLVAGMDESFVHLEAFVEMYYETMDRAGATRYYYFPREYFRDLRQALGQRLFLCVVTSASGDLLCGALFTECQGIVQYHLSAAYTAALPTHATKLMLDWVRSWAQQRGNRVLHLGGGMGAREDSLFQFKARFSRCRHAFFTWQIQFSPEAYQRLEQRRRGIDELPLEEGYFPIYRA